MRPRRTAAIPVDNPYCSCKLTRPTAALPVDNPCCSCKPTRPTAALPMDNPCCSCKPTRVRPPGGGGAPAGGRARGRGEACSRNPYGESLLQLCADTCAAGVSALHSTCSKSRLPLPRLYCCCCHTFFPGPLGTSARLLVCSSALPLQQGGPDRRGVCVAARRRSGRRRSPRARCVLGPGGRTASRSDPNSSMLIPPGSKRRCPRAGWPHRIP